ncbi:unnamed protein product [marine sediment metagenome]|uniref:Prenylated flavin chaperone LpdD-like domain-containing protein n=1 Tax=marine sediment metagenome TaxID=412755 RepID=X1C853_9ZZZZ
MISYCFAQLVDLQQIHTGIGDLFAFFLHEEKRDLVCTLRVSEKKDNFEVFAQVNELGDDLLVILYGGPRPHIGAIGIVQPRFSLKDPETIGGTSSVFTFLGHKEDVVAKEMSEELASKLNGKVVVVARMHWEGLQGEGIDEAIGLCQRLTEKILIRIRGG